LSRTLRPPRGLTGLGPAKPPQSSSASIDNREQLQGGAGSHLSKLWGERMRHLPARQIRFHRRNKGRRIGNRFWLLGSMACRRRARIAGKKAREKYPAVPVLPRLAPF